MMFWAVNLKPFPCLPGGVSPFGSPTSHRCPQSQMHPRQTARTAIWFSCKGFSREKRDRKAQFPLPPLLPWSTQRTQTRDLLGQVLPSPQPPWSRGRSEVRSTPPSGLLTTTSSRVIQVGHSRRFSEPQGWGHPRLCPSLCLC